MKQEIKKMKPIWYFVGLVLIAMGGLILMTGIYHWIYPPETPKVLYKLHSDFWWGAVMVISGCIFFFKNRHVTID
jgi:hypothetical protein